LPIGKRPHWRRQPQRRPLMSYNNNMLVLRRNWLRLWQPATLSRRQHQ
jgi:hypothetical protein